MTKKKVAILGITGMLGSMVLNVFTNSDEFEVVAIDRKNLDAEKADVEDILRAIKGANWVINAIGVIKPYIRDVNQKEIERAIYVNSVFPNILAKASEKSKSKVIQIATDCVYSGIKGKYIETDDHDALDVYGKTKSLGEVYGENFYNLRCSIIGMEPKGHLSLLDWFLNQPKDAKVNGFTNHLWNGVTTLHFAKLCLGIVRNNLDVSNVVHVVPGNVLSKYELLKEISKEYDRQDIKITKIKSENPTDRTLSTNDEGLNQKIWKIAGYHHPPTIQQMVNELRLCQF